jgi:hypothetical protein
VVAVAALTVVFIKMAALLLFLTAGLAVTDLA